uniref:Progestin and adipoQ receptor family member 3 n=1 Tax=Timema genevievae TaxID=629358 RepID=A0A7R9JT97_TIMGE|nr:unnamed protein product [Timema genevievae]
MIKVEFRGSVPAFAWRESGRPFSGKISTPDRDSNPYLPVIGSLVQHDSDASDHAASEAGLGGVLKMYGWKGSETSGGSKVVESSPQPELREYKDALGPLLSYNEAPSHLKFNPYIRSGYRGLLTTKMCLESIFWWTNETVNIWSHIFGWMLFMGLTLYDLVLLNIHASFTDKFIVALLLVCFQVCMVLSSLYHTFSCRSEKDYMCFLSFDLFGIALSLLAIYMSGVYYAFWCHKEWQTFYLVTVLIIFMFAMVLQVPRLKVDANVKLIVFVVWAAYGVIPTFHWTVVMGGYANPVVEVSAHRVGTARTAHFRGGAPTIRTDGTDGDSVCSAALEPEGELLVCVLKELLLPRVLGMYGISGLAFLIYFFKFPERYFSVLWSLQTVSPLLVDDSAMELANFITSVGGWDLANLITSVGKVDYVGSSHQWWHLFVVLALYYWHNTGIKYVEFRMSHGHVNCIGKDGNKCRSFRSDKDPDASLLTCRCLAMSTASARTGINLDPSEVTKVLMHPYHVLGSKDRSNMYSPS